MKKVKIKVYGEEMTIQPDAVVRTFRKVSECLVLMMITAQNGIYSEYPIDVYKEYGCTSDEFIHLFWKECNLANGEKEKPTYDGTEAKAD